MKPSSIRKRKRLRKQKIASILRNVPETLAVDLLTLTVCSSYVASLANNLRIRRYLAKYHFQELNEIDRLLAQIKRIYCAREPQERKYSRFRIYSERE